MSTGERLDELEDEHCDIYNAREWQLELFSIARELHAENQRLREGMIGKSGVSENRCLLCNSTMGQNGSRWVRCQKLGCGLKDILIPTDAWRDLCRLFAKRNDTITKLHTLLDHR